MNELKRWDFTEYFTFGQYAHEMRPREKGEYCLFDDVDAYIKERLPEWEPIESAPKDGSHIQLYRRHIQFTGYHSEVGWRVVSPDCSRLLIPPTHWKPLSDAPTEAET